MRVILPTNQLSGLAGAVHLTDSVLASVRAAGELADELSDEFAEKFTMPPASIGEWLDSDPLARKIPKDQAAALYDKYLHQPSRGPLSQRT